jgi:hypothetical protein
LRGNTKSNAIHEIGRQTWRGEYPEAAIQAALDAIYKANKKLLEDFFRGKRIRPKRAR